ncbi:hypothetical protein Pint_21347 [Pistacia integerrima]|uniref:Uncharacterized protein n=1 Tax=Pistacia integerrima TaxID=434235 RepID=A0ACC0XB51_9ROSI|nr:hypothetical protein Pint_21347 [Pistacia integerrima]
MPLRPSFLSSDGSWRLSSLSAAAVLGLDSPTSSTSPRQQSNNIEGSKWTNPRNGLLSTATCNYGVPALEGGCCCSLGVFDVLLGCLLLSSVCISVVTGKALTLDEIIKLCAIPAESSGVSVNETCFSESHVL